MNKITTVCYGKEDTWETKDRLGEKLKETES